jgi:hypothetical protein
MKRIGYVVALAVMAFGSCTDSNDEKINDPLKDNVIRVATNINDIVETKSTSEYTGDGFSLYISPKSQENSYTYKNVFFSRSGSDWTPANNEKLCWQDQSTDYEYFAYAPVLGTSGTANSVEDNQNCIRYSLSDKSSSLCYDLLWANGEGLASQLAPNGVLNIEFKHEFCRFTVDVEVGSGFYKSSKDNPISAVYFTNATGSGYFNVKTGQFLNTSEVRIAASAGTHTAGTLTESGRYVTGGDFMAPGNQSTNVVV